MKLYWANHDQYYIKTSEYLKNYAFKVGDDRKVRFELVEATTEKDNNKKRTAKSDVLKSKPKNLWKFKAMS
ncbi:MAG: hypothetical protein HC803_00860 [Saprospiraceae bacterium]|nr:hypothetical protein [Saprospiraceae bacterium]